MCTRPLPQGTGGSLPLVEVKQSKKPCIKELLRGLAVNSCKGWRTKGFLPLVEAPGYGEVCIEGHAKQVVEAAAAGPELYLHIPLHTAARQWPVGGGALTCTLPQGSGQ